MLQGEGLSSDAFQGLLSMVGIQGDALPDRLAHINAVLDALPPELSEELLIRFLNGLYSPTP